MSGSEGITEGPNGSLGLDTDGNCLEKSGSDANTSVAVAAKAKAHIGRGIAISLQLKEVILNLKKYFQQKNQNWNLADISYEIFLATRVSETSIRKVLAEFKRFNCLKEPKTTRNRAKKVGFTPSDKETIESIVYELYSGDKVPELIDLYNAIKGNDKMSFKNCTKGHFYKLLKQMGFKTNRNRNKYFVERPDITAKKEEIKLKKKSLSQKAKQIVQN